MSFNKVNSDGSVTRVAGQGKAEYGASTVRKGTVGVPTIAANVDYVDQTITFSTPMPDTDYLVDLSLQGSNTHRVAFHVVANTKTVNGFTVRFTPIGIKQTTEVGVSGIANNLSYMLTVQRDDAYPNLTKNTALIDPAVSLPTEWNPMQTGYLRNPMPANEATLVYTAFKLYTDTEYNSLLDLPDRVEAVEEAMAITTGTGTRNATYVKSDSFTATWTKIGHVVTAEVQFNLSQATLSTEELITGFPKPVCPVAVVAQGEANDAAYGLVLRTNGSIRTHYQGIADQFYHATITYITAE